MWEIMRWFKELVIEGKARLLKKKPLFYIETTMVIHVEQIDDAHVLHLTLTKPYTGERIAQLNKILVSKEDTVTLVDMKVLLEIEVD